MASAEIFTLSSSPPREHACDTYTLSSSPLPSLSEIIHRMPAIRTGSNAATISKEACATFTSASSLLNKPSLDRSPNVNTIRSFRLERSNTGLAESSKNKINASRAAPPKVKKPKAEATKSTGADNIKEKAPRKPRARNNDGEATMGASKAKAPRKPRANKADMDPVDDEPQKGKAVRKPKVKKKDDDFQTQISANRVTKNLPLSNVEGKDLAEKPASLKKSKVDRNKAKAEVDKDFGLVEAITRRTTWTPPRSSVTISAPHTDSPGRDWEKNTSPDGPAARSAAFGDLLGNFGFTGKGHKPQEASTTADVVTRKRKRIELVVTSAIPAVSKTPKEKKTKAPKKKARTLTGLATSAYAEEEEAPEPPPAPILQFLSNPIKSLSSADGFKVPPRPKKGTSSEPILLSPESAMKQVANQDFVFGTSSQLAREESPTLLRDLHEVMKASNELNDPFDDPFSSPVAMTDLDPVKRGKITRPTNPNLWSAASRDDSGNLLDVEMVDMVDSPAVAAWQKTAVAPNRASNEVSKEDNEWHDVDDLPLLPSPQRCKPIVTKCLPTNEIISGVRCSSTVVEATVSESELSALAPTISKTSRDFEELVKSPGKAAGKKGSPKKLPEKPDYASFTTAQLAKEIASYRFKPIKSRGAMIILLEKCWESKHGIISGVLASKESQAASPLKTSKAAKGPTGAPKVRDRPRKDASASNSPSKVPARRPRGRPRKDSAAIEPSPQRKSVSQLNKVSSIEYLEMDSDAPLSMVRTPKRKANTKLPPEEISDSEGPSTPSPLRRQLSDPKPPAVTLPLDVEEDDTLLLSPVSKQQHTFQRITEAVMNATPTKDPNHPSWYEKILMYDPIILEDLTAWLNTGALDKVGYDGEVEPKEVKKWCESKSICCLWRENLRGGARARY